MCKPAENCIVPWKLRVAVGPAALAVFIVHCIRISRTCKRNKVLLHHKPFQPLRRQPAVVERCLVDFLLFFYKIYAGINAAIFFSYVFSTKFLKNMIILWKKIWKNFCWHKFIHIFDHIFSYFLYKIFAGINWHNFSHIFSYFLYKMFENFMEENMEEFLLA